MAASEITFLQGLVARALDTEQSHTDSTPAVWDSNQRQALRTEALALAAALETPGDVLMRVLNEVGCGVSLFFGPPFATTCIPSIDNLS